MTDLLNPPQKQQDSPSFTGDGTSYPGNYVDETPPPDGEYVKFDFPDPALMVNYFDRAISDGHVTLYPWQEDALLQIANAKATAKDPFKYVLLASNGSGKDKFVIAPLCIWFLLTKIKSRVIITTASGQQLTGQTEPYIKDLAEKVNKHYGTEVIRVRQRYIKCLKTGSEIRMFATDEAGKAEGFHPIEPNSEMLIIVNEGKTVTEDIHKALRRCTGFNYWLEISSAGQPKGYLHWAYNNWPNRMRVTSYDCPHQSQAEIEEDRRQDGEESAFFRSKHLSLFTSIDGNVVISVDVITNLINNPPKYRYPTWKKRVGIDLAAGGDETTVCITKGNECFKELWFREANTVVAAKRISDFLQAEGFVREYDYIYADDGGVGRSIIDMLVDNHGWKNVHRVMNQWTAIGNDKRFGNRGAQNWWRVKRILEEGYFDVRKLSAKTLEQLYNRHYRQSDGNGKIYLRSKPEEKSEGLPSPDRADAFILSLTGLTIEDFASSDERREYTEPIEEKPELLHTALLLKMQKPETIAHSDFLDWYEREIKFRESTRNTVKPANRIFNSLKRALNI